MTTVLVTIAATWAAVILIAAMADSEVREALAGVLLSPLLVVAYLALRMVYPRILHAGPKRLGRRVWKAEEEVSATVIVAGRKGALVYLSTARDENTQEESNRG